MPAKDDTSDPNAVHPASAEEFADSLKHRGEAAKGLERDLLTTVPLLYGSPRRLEPRGDPGVVLAQIHRDEMLRRNGGGVLQAGSRRSDVALQFERTMEALAIVILLLCLFGNLNW